MTSCPNAFSLHFSDTGALEKTHYYFYEADRKTMNVPKMNRKFRSHFYYVVKQKLHREHYGVNRIRAVLIESIESGWAEHLRINAQNLNSSENGGFTLTGEVEHFEIDLIRNALIQTRGHQIKAAEILGIKITTLSMKLKRYNIDARSFIVPDVEHRDLNA